MLTVHHLGVSQSERIIWLCEELGIPYELKLYERDPVTMFAPESYRALHPLGTAPIITDGDLVLPESGAIMEYIIHKHGGGRLAVGPEAANYADYLFWYHFANGSMMPNGMAEMIVNLLGGASHPMVALLLERSGKAYKLVEQRLGEVPYFAGDEFTAADIIMGFPLTTMRAFVPHQLEDMPNLRAYLQRIGARPAYQAAMQKGDPGRPPFLS